MRLARSLGLPPKIFTSPDVAWLSPNSKRTAVVLPAPLGPSKATTSPAWSWREKRSRAICPPNFLVTSRSEATGESSCVYRIALRLY